MYPLDRHGVKKWGDMTLPAPMDAPPMLVANVVGELQRKRTLAASRGFLAAARLSC